MRRGACHRRGDPITRVGLTAMKNLGVAARSWGAKFCRIQAGDGRPGIGAAMFRGLILTALWASPSRARTRKIRRAADVTLQRRGMGGNAHRHQWQDPTPPAPTRRQAELRRPVPNLAAASRRPPRQPSGTDARHPARRSTQWAYDGQALYTTLDAAPGI